MKPDWVLFKVSWTEQIVAAGFCEKVEPAGAGAEPAISKSQQSTLTTWSGFSNVGSKISSPDGRTNLTETIPFFGEIRDPKRPCFGFLCMPLTSKSDQGTRSGISFLWVERFSQHRCCQFESQPIAVGQRLVMDDLSVGDVCRQLEVSCLLRDDQPFSPPVIFVQQKQTK